ncbi:MAG: hypothetical protein J3Q66DRAFT_390344 [Benniella sp.]|nr:MAG: hypothetical protein J3Q66DRAFT_390344 [Benniella sp.]
MCLLGILIDSGDAKGCRLTFHTEGEETKAAGTVPDGLYPRFVIVELIVVVVLKVSLAEPEWEQTWQERREKCPGGTPWIRYSSRVGKGRKRRSKFFLRAQRKKSDRNVLWPLSRCDKDFAATVSRSSSRFSRVQEPSGFEALLLSFDLDFYFFCFDSAVLFLIQSIELLRTRCRSVLNRPSREEIPNGYELSAGNCTRSQSTLRVVL